MILATWTLTLFFNHFVLPLCVELLSSSIFFKRFWSKADPYNIHYIFYYPFSLQFEKRPKYGGQKASIFTGVMFIYLNLDLIKNVQTNKTFSLAFLNTGLFLATPNLQLYTHSLVLCVTCTGWWEVGSISQGTFITCSSLSLECFLCLHFHFCFWLSVYFMTKGVIISHK